MSTRIENESPARASRAKPIAQTTEVDLGFLDDVHFAHKDIRRQVTEYLQQNPEAVEPLRWFKDNVPQEYAPHGLSLRYSGASHDPDARGIMIHAHNFWTGDAWKDRPDRAKLVLNKSRFQGLWRKRFEPVPVSKHLYPAL